MISPPPAYDDAVALVLAAGLSSRFAGGNKLLQDLGGRPVASHIAATLLALPFQRRLAICTAGPVAEIYDGLGFDVIINDAPEAGMGRSLQLGVNAAGQSELVLICLADMPLVAEPHLAALFAAMPQASSGVVASSAATYRGPPALLSRKILDGMVFDGDQGARLLMQQALLVPTAADRLLDVDTTAALEQARIAASIQQ